MTGMLAGAGAAMAIRAGSAVSFNRLTNRISGYREQMYMYTY